MTTKQNECNSFCAGLGSVADRITALLIDYKVWVVRAHPGQVRKIRPLVRACLIPRGWRLRRALEAGYSISVCVLCEVYDS